MLHAHACGILSAALSMQRCSRWLKRLHFCFGRVQHKSELEHRMASAPRSLPAASSLFATPGVGWHDKISYVDKLKFVDKDNKSTAGFVQKEADNNQDDEGPQEVSDKSLQPRIETHFDDDEIHRLRNENDSLAQRLAIITTQHAQDIGDLEAKLQHAVKTHKEIEQRLRTQLRTVLRQQQEAAENVRKVRGILTRVSTWVRQIQRAAHTQRPPRGSSLATNVQGCHESPTAVSNKFAMAQDDIPESFELQVNTISEAIESLPPPAPGRNRVKDEPGKGFSYVGYTGPSSISRPAEIVLKPIGGHSIVLDGLPSDTSAPRRDSPVPKRSAGAILAFCAQVVTTSLAGVRSSPSKATSAWKLIGLHPVREENEIDQEAGQWSSQQIDQDQPLNVSLPNLSLGLL